MLTSYQERGLVFLAVLAFTLVVFFVQRVVLNESFVDVGRCGPNLGVCPNWPGTNPRCINGYCKSDVPPQLPAVSPLPIRPARYTDPTPLLREKAAL
jgi:hypothetical protein